MERFTDIHRAMAFGAKYHEGQTRKGTGEPYINHPHAVMMILRDHGFLDSVTLIAALLHDVIEDTKATERDVLEAFGPEVLALVLEVTNVSTGSTEPRAQRKAMDRAHVAGASSVGQSLKVADIIHNISTVAHLDHKFARLYITEKRAMVAVLTKAKASLIEAANAALDAAESEIEAHA